ncbi:MAG TPA: threonine synthase [Abditibacterium sp.]|jgi:threonine synthase
MISSPESAMMWRGLIENYRAHLPVSDATPVITLHEGNTPLIHAPRLAAQIAPDCELYLKFEGANPTGSFKDRGMTMAVSKAAEKGAKVAICASTGNTSAAAAAYCAVAGIRCVVLIPNGNIALGKLAQALVSGATVLAIEGNFDDGLRIVKDLTANYPIEMLNNINPHRLEGQKTGAFEICDFFGHAPDFHFLPVGNGGNITAYWKGYREYLDLGRIDSLPKIGGFQAAGAAPLVLEQMVDHPETLATAIRIGHPVRYHEAMQVRAESGGLFGSVTDDEILVAQKTTAALSGIFGEPACAAPLAGITNLSKQGYFAQAREELGRKPIVVSVVTGHGLKDPNTAIRIGGEPTVVPAENAAVLRAIGF